MDAEIDAKRSTPEAMDSLLVYSTLLKTVKNSDPFAKNCEKIIAGLKNLSSVAYKYDLSKDHNVNGFRSYLKLMHKFGCLVLKDCQSHQREEVDPNFVHMSNVLLKAMELMLKFRDEKLISDNGEVSGVDVIHTAFQLEEDLKAMMGKNRNFWLCSSMRRALNHYINLIVLMSSPITSLFKLHNCDFKAKIFTEFSLHTSSSFVKKLWSLSELSLYKTLLPLYLYKFRPRIAKTVFIPRKTSIVINPLTSELTIDNEAVENSQKPIRCRFLQEREFGRSPNNCLVFHCHGAGFLCQSPDSHEVYLKDWASKLSGVPILSIDYSLSPESKYPIALQEVLDVYLFLISKSERVEQIIGFLPEKIVLCGDSAGAILVISLTLILNDVQKVKDIKMPSDIIAFYPVGLLRVNPSPSRMFILFDTFLTVGVLLSIVDAYLTTTESDADNKDELSNQVWYRKDIFQQRLCEINEIAKHPYISPLLYNDFESLQKVNLTIVVGEFDPFLDDCIEMARKWKGNVTFDVVRDLSHGFLYFRAVSKEAKEACDLSLKRITQTLVS